MTTPFHPPQAIPVAFQVSWIRVLVPESNICCRVDKGSEQQRMASGADAMMTYQADLHTGPDKHQVIEPTKFSCEVHLSESADKVKRVFCT